MPCRTHFLTCAPDFGAPLSWPPNDSLARPAPPQRLKHATRSLRAPRNSLNTFQTCRPTQEGIPKSPRRLQVPAASTPTQDAVFCGAYAALQCSPDSSSTQAMMQLQALAVADLALRELADLANGCTSDRASAQSCQRSMYHSEHDRHANLTEEQPARLQSYHTDVLRAVRGLGETYLVAGQAGEHLEIHPSIMRMWERVCYLFAG
jgi:hypothetical protein